MALETAEQLQGPGVRCEESGDGRQLAQGGACRGEARGAVSRSRAGQQPQVVKQRIADRRPRQAGIVDADQPARTEVLPRDPPYENRRPRAYLLFLIAIAFCVAPSGSSSPVPAGNRFT